MTPPTRRADGGGQARVVWAAWALLSAGALLLVARYGRNVPYWDDWKLVPVLLGGKPLTLHWLWMQNNEHRLPIAKLLMWALSRLSGGDLRWVMVLSALVLSGLAALLLVAVRRLAGDWRWTDVAFPVALLHWGHAENLLWHVDLHIVLATSLFVAAVVTLLALLDDERAARAPARGRRLALFATAGLLPLQSGIGLSLSPVLLLWVLVAARSVRDPSRRRALGLCAALMALLLTVCLANLPSSPAADTGFQGPVASLLTALRCATTSLGPVGLRLWPWSGLLVAGLGLATAALLVRVIIRAPELRLSSSALLAGLAGVAGLALAIGVARAGLGWSAGFQARYVTLVCPALCFSYLAWRLHGGAVGRRLVPAIVAVGLCVALPANTVLGLRQAQERAAVLDAFALDVAAGMTPEDLARTHGSSLCPDNAVLISRLELLQQTGRWLYRRR